jgi:hypothetical protein
LKEGKIVEGGIICFFHFFPLVNGTCQPIWHPMVIKHYMLYLICTLHISNPLNLTIGSRLILI